MPEWVIVGEDSDGLPVVVVEWIGELVTRNVFDVAIGAVPPAVFTSRWDAKRVLRKRNEWRKFRCVRRAEL